MKKLVIVFLLLGAFVGGLQVTVHLYLDKKVNLAEKAIIEIHKGASLTSVAGHLSGFNLIDYPRIFVKVGQFYGYADKLKYGEYEISPQDSYLDLFKKITSGDTFRYRVTLVEGEHMYEYGRLLEEAGLCKADDFLKMVKDPAVVQELLGESLPSLEGYLFPETYAFSKSDDLKTMVTTMVKNFLKETSGVIPSGGPLSRHQIVTLASIVEKETGAPFERAKISSVFHNRLKKRMRLQTDPTIIYGILDQTGREISNIRKSDITKPTAYNTYVIGGLPPGPIGNPGIEAIKAAVNPDTTPYLYFVSQNDGTHVFTTSYKDHLKAVKKFQLNPSMREGKSWRDLKSKKAQ